MQSHKNQQMKPCVYSKTVQGENVIYNQDLILEAK